LPYVDGLTSLAKPQAYCIGRGLQRIAQYLDGWSPRSDAPIRAFIPILGRAIASRQTGNGAEFGAADLALAFRRWLVGLERDRSVRFDPATRARIVAQADSIERAIAAFALSRDPS
jgi:hypothetical protein